MAEFIRSNILDAHTMATEVKTYDLPINPISHVILTVEGYGISAITNVTIPDILGFLNLITIRHTGIQVINLQSEDLANLNLYLYGSGGTLLHPVFGANEWFTYSLIIPFGRTLFNPEECFPATRKGEFQITLDTTLPVTTWDNAILSLATVELPEATPARHLVSTLFSIAAPGATGEKDIDLPIANDILAVLIRMTSFPTASEFLFGIDDIRLLVDNRETAIVSAKAPGLIAEMISRAPITGRTPPTDTTFIPNNSLWMDFDPTRDGAYAIDTRGRSRVHLRANYGVNEAVWIAPLELRTL